MKTLNQLRMFNRVINASILWLLISLLAVVIVFSFMETAVSIVIAFIYLILLMLVFIGKLSIHLVKYTIICEELSSLINSNICFEGDVKFSAYCRIVEKKNYCIVNLVVKGRLAPEVYSKIAIIANEYLGSVETVIERAFILNMTKEN